MFFQSRTSSRGDNNNSDSWWVWVDDDQQQQRGQCGVWAESLGAAPCSSRYACCREDAALEDNKSIISFGGRRRGRVLWGCSSMSSSTATTTSLTPLIPVVSLLIGLVTLLFFLRRRYFYARPRSRSLSNEAIPLRSRTFSETVLWAGGGSKPVASRPRLWSTDRSGSRRLRIPSDGAVEPSLASPNAQYDLFRELDLLEDDPVQTAFLKNVHQLHLDSPQQFQYYGPAVHTITYPRTWSPPPSWKEASRRLLPQDAAKMSLHRLLELSFLPPEQQHSHHYHLHENGGADSVVDGSWLTVKEVPQDEQADEATFSPSGSPTRKNKQHQQTESDKHVLLHFPVSGMGVHAQPPANGGVLELYVKDSDRQQWMEFTFGSARDAAQFQIDVMALQVLGEPLKNMFKALQLIHVGSRATRAKEFVLCDDGQTQQAETAPDSSKESNSGDGGPEIPSSATMTTTSLGIAWDDVMRSLGSSFPTIRLRLEQIWWRQEIEQTSNTELVAPSTTESGAGGSTSDADTSDNQDSILLPEYDQKRKLIGPVDFFRLFVPVLPETAVPQIQSSPERTEQMLRWRKRVARASLLVRAYVRARTIVNKEWKLQLPVVPSTTSGDHHSLKHRLAYDDNTYNTLYDAAARNEVYEASVSRDVICQVRGPGLSKKPAPFGPFGSFGLPNSNRTKKVDTFSGYQGYAFVGTHTFQLPDNNEDHLLRFGKDPVSVLPSLRTLIESHSDLDFFVVSSYPVEQEVAKIVLFVRSLSKGIDPSFDNVVERFVDGDAEVRNRKLELLVQLGFDRNNVSLFGWLYLTVVTFLLRFLTEGRVFVAQTSATHDRTPIPAVHLASVFNIHHFGGSLQTDRTLPRNYVAVSVSPSPDSRSKRIGLSRLVLHIYREKRGLPYDVVDLSIVLAGEKEDELPERVLATVRQCHMHNEEVALAIPFSSPDSRPSPRGRINEPKSLRESLAMHPIGVYFHLFVSGPASDFIAWMSREPEPKVGVSPRRHLSSDDSFPSQGLEAPCQKVASLDPFEKAVNEMIDILSDVKVPVRKSQLARVDSETESTIPPLSLSLPLISGTPSVMGDEILQVSILRRVTRSDIRRYFVASNCKLKKAALHLVTSSAWRGVTFPIDIRACRIELQSGQFFQQGRDLDGNPVFYFRNMLLGRWRKDKSAVISAVLHRLESSLKGFVRENPDVRCTLIVLMGKPFRAKREKEENDQGSPPDSGSVVAEDEKGESVSGTLDPEDGGAETVADGGAETVADGDSVLAIDEPMRIDYNPRINSGEQWHVHSSKYLIEELIATVMNNYPERLARALVVVGKGDTTYFRTAVGGSLVLAKAIASARTRGKVRFLLRYKDLRQYVAKHELSALVGGTAPVSRNIFDGE